MNGLGPVAYTSKRMLAAIKAGPRLYHYLAVNGDSARGHTLPLYLGADVAKHLTSLSDQTIRLHMGELTAQEMRAVKAFIAWQAALIASETGQKT